MQFDIKQLVVFIQVVEQSSFSGAAKVLGMAQASVSERIANLEKEIGARLVNRLGRKVELTQVGRVLLRRAKEIISLRDATVGELNQLLGVRKGSVRLGGSSAPGEYLLPTLLGRFSMQYPELKVSLNIGDSQEMIGNIEQGILEMGFVGARFPHEHIVFKKTWTDQIVLAIHPQHKWANRKKSISPDELSKEPWIVREPGSGTRIAADKCLKKILPGGLEEVQVIAELGSVTAIKEGIKAGLGVAFVSAVTVASDVKNGSIRILPVEGLSTGRHFYLIRDKRRVLSPAADVLWKFIQKETTTA